MTTSTTNTRKCSRCDGTGLFDFGGDLGRCDVCFLCRGKGYRTAEEIASDREFRKVVRTRVEATRLVERFSRTIRNADLRYTVVADDLLPDVVLAVQNGTEMHPDAHYILDHLLANGVDFIAFVEAQG